MIDILLWVMLVILIFVSYLDIKYKAVPSIILTGTLFIVALLRIENLQFGILAGLFAWVIKDLIYEWNGLDFGMADIKIMIMIGFLIPTIEYFIVFAIVFSLFQFIYTLVWEWKFKGKEKERPFIPCLFAVYITLMIVGGIV